MTQVPATYVCTSGRRTGRRGWAWLYLLVSGLACVNVTPPWGGSSRGGGAGTATMGAGGSLAGALGAGGASRLSSAIDANSDTTDQSADVSVLAPPDEAGGDGNGDAMASGGVVATGGGLVGGATGSGGATDTPGSGGGTGAPGTGGVGGTGTSTIAGQGGATSTGGTTMVPVVDAALDGRFSDAPCPLCALRAVLVHRYSFSGVGIAITDSVGTAHGTAVNAQLSGSGALALSGGTDQYVDLPDGILSSLDNATIEIWVSWAGGAPNQRILDFGSNGLVNGKVQATTTVMLSPNSAPTGITPRLRASYSSQVSLSGTFVDGSGTLSASAMNHLVAVFDGQKHELSLYLNGALQGKTGNLGALSLIHDSNNWLGHSQYAEDPGFAGTYYELRIYAAALTAQQIQASFSEGPNASFGPQ